jgi:hypothetical protein
VAADFYIARSYEELVATRAPIELSLESNGYYWFLYRYFQAANLDHEHELVDLYGGGSIGGYQLDRLEEELQTALLDIETRPASWAVLVGWLSEAVCRETEERKVIEKTTLVALIHHLLELIKRARESNCQLVYIGD